MVFVFDLDGVVWHSEEPIPSAIQTLKDLRAAGYRVVFCTNNSSKTRDDYAAKLGGMGVTATEEEVFTSAFATAQYLRERGAMGRRFYVVGEEGLCEELRALDAELLGTGEILEEDVVPDYVIVGVDWDFNYETLAAAQQGVLRGAELIATNRDPAYPFAPGVLRPGAGAMVAAVEACCGKQALVMGKPEARMLEAVWSALGAGPEETVMVGDRVDSDIQMAKKAGCRSVLVLTGITRKEEAARIPEELRPDLVLEELSLEGLVGGGG